MIKDMRLINISLLLLVFLMASPALAQLDTSFNGTTQATLVLDPAFPKPGELVTVSLNSYGSNVYNANIVWSYNGETVTDATNKRTIQIIAGDLGETNSVTASLVTQSGSEQQVSTIIEPKYVDIVIEPQTRVPNFYTGRALPSVGSSINATALINNGTGDKRDLIYTWRLNNKVLSNGPIRGSNQISFDMPRGSQSTLSLEIVNVTGAVVGRKAIILESVRPGLVFYESNALYGSSQNSITNSLVLLGANTTIVAEPYYLDTRTYNNPDISEWEIDNTTKTTNSGNPYEITIQKLQAGGSSRINFHVRSTTEVLQGAQANIEVIF